MTENKLEACREVAAQRLEQNAPEEGRDEGGTLRWQARVPGWGLGVMAGTRDEILAPGGKGLFLGGQGWGGCRRV